MSVFILACNANKSTTEDLHSNTQQTVCPENGTCTFEVLKNKDFNMKEDPFGNSYSELIDGDKTVLKFEYVKNTQPELQDDHYSEVVYVVVENDMPTLELTNQELSEVKAGFSRICYCKGQTGTYPIKTGTLSISKQKNDRYYLSFSFTVTEVPQIISEINESFEL